MSAAIMSKIDIKEFRFFWSGVTLNPAGEKNRYALESQGWREY